MAEEKFEDYVYMNKIYLSLLGLWPVSEKSLSCQNCVDKFRAISIAIVIWLLLIPPMMLDLYIVWGDINAVVQNLCFTLHGICLALKITHLISNRNTLTEILRKMKHNFDNSLSTTTSADQKIILIEYANFARFVTKGFVFSLYFLQVTLNLLPFIYGLRSDPVRYRIYPYCSWYYFDQYSNTAYAVCYGIQLCIGIICGQHIVLGVDTFIFVSIWHSCGQLSIIQSKLLHIGGEFKVSSDTMKEIVRIHNMQINVVHLLKQLFSKLCFYQFITSASVICCSGFQIIMSLNKTKSSLGETILYIALFVANFFQILLYCWPGNELMEKSAAIGNAAYSSLRTDLPRKSAKAIILMILRAQKPLVISAGGMYDMTLENFTGIVKINMSLLSVLRAFSSS